MALIGVCSQWDIKLAVFISPGHNPYISTGHPASTWAGKVNILLVCTG